MFVLAHNPREIPGWLFVIAVIMAHGNSAVNPILYGMSNERFREGYRSVLGCTRRSRSVAAEEPPQPQTARTAPRSSLMGRARKSDLYEIPA